MTSLKKVLILTNNLPHYRIPVFKLLAEKYDLTVAFSIGKSEKGQVGFTVIKLPITKWNRLVIHKDNIFKLCQKYDVIIALGDIAWLKISFLPFYKKRKYKVIFWSIGVSASYEKKYDAVTYWDCVRDYFYKRADALVFYADYPIKKYINRGFCKEKLFVAPNTVEVYNDNDLNEIKKDSLLFIGTLYPEKGIVALLENYKSAYNESPDIHPLNIIGGGVEFEKIDKWIISNKLNKKITLLGPIYDNKIKSIYFRKAFACISPFQAGLSVLESMGYGVPYITMHDAITGGERLNILNGTNGIILKNPSQIKEIIINVSEDCEKYTQMGKNALEYYNNIRKLDDMVKGLYNAIEFVCME
jgi:glycosyltransferase involved in cell wall biosynthesis